MIKRITTSHFILNLFNLFFVLLIGVRQLSSACQPPIHYHSSAAYGSPQFQPDSQQQAPDFQSSNFAQSSLQDELVQNQVQSNAIESESNTDSATTPLTSSTDELSRPPNPFVPIESQAAEKSANECANKNLQLFMDVLDCTAVETYNTDGATARYGSNDCGFEPQNLCRFYSAPDEELQFRRGVFAHSAVQQNDSQFNQFEASFSSLTNRPLGSVPNKNFLVVAEPFGNTPNAAAILQTDIRCQIGDGSLSFDYWTTVDDIVLKVCTRVGQDRRCTTDIFYALNSTSVQIQVVHPEGNSFVVEIIATSFNRPGFFIIDNLNYQADLCEITSDFPAVSDQHLIARPSSARAFSQPNFDIDGPFLSINGKSGEEPTTPPSTEIKSDESNQQLATVPSVLIDSETKRWSNSIKIQKVGENVCDVLNCNFNHNLCHYSQPETKDTLMQGKWQTANLRLDNNGTRQGNGSVAEGFAFVGMSDRSTDKTKGRKIYVLESGDFDLKEDATLSFDVYRRSNAISLQVCIDSLSNCYYEAPPVRSTSYWKLGETVLLPKGSKKIYFVAEQLKRFKWLALDNFKLLSSECSSV